LVFLVSDVEIGATLAETLESDLKDLAAVEAESKAEDGGEAATDGTESGARRVCDSSYLKPCKNRVTSNGS
jgi:hypothetical protein